MTDDELDRSHTGLPVAALVLGIIGVVLSPFVFGGALGLAGAILGIVHRARRAHHRGMAAWGIALGLVSVLASGAAAAVYYYTYRHFQKEMARYQGSSEAGDAETGHEDWVGRPAPALTVTTIEGETIQLEQFRGRPVVLNFWATWCGACREELPDLNRVAREQADVVILGLSDENDATLQAFARKNPFDIRVASLPHPPAPFDAIDTIPTNVFVDRKGVIREVRVGSMNAEAIRTAALAPDYAGTPPPAARPTPDLAERALAEQWKAPIDGITSLAKCDWDGDENEDVVALAGSSVRVLDAAGKPLAQISLPRAVSAVECARVLEGEIRLLAYDVDGREVSVHDRAGKTLWSYRGSAPVRSAHWADLDGDGTPELTVGLAGKDGLHAASLDGRRLWRSDVIGDVRNHDVVTPESGSATLAVTSATGAVDLFDGTGAHQGTLAPLRDTYAPLAARIVDEEATIQILAAGKQHVVAFDVEGKVQWKVPAPVVSGAWRTPFIVAGDLTGDALPEWVFPVAAQPRTLAAYSPSGTRLASLALPAPETTLVVLTTDDKDLLVVASLKDVRAYRLD